MYISFNPRSEFSTPIQSKFYENILVVVNWNNARYNPNMKHWRTLYPPTLFPNVVHYGPAPIPSNSTVKPDSFIQNERIHFHFPGEFGYASLLHSFSNLPHPFHSTKNPPSGILWLNFDVWINALAFADRKDSKDRIWYPRERLLGSLDAHTKRPWWWWWSQDSGLAACAKMMKGGGLSAGRVSQLYRLWGVGGEKSGRSGSDDIMGTGVCAAPYPVHWGNLRKLGGGSDAIYVPWSARHVVDEVLGSANETGLFLELALPLFVDVASLEGIESLDVREVWEMVEIPPRAVQNRWNMGDEYDLVHQMWIKDKERLDNWLQFQSWLTCKNK
jgi:hypothetical protein